MENFVEYSRDRIENQIGLVLKRQANQYLLVIPMDKIIYPSYLSKVSEIEPVTRQSLTVRRTRFDTLVGFEKTFDQTW